MPTTTLVAENIPSSAPSAEPNGNSPAQRLGGIEQERWLAEIIAVCGAAARGELEPRLLGLPEEGDIRPALLSINHLLDLVDAFVRESRAALVAASEGRFHRQVLPEGMLGSFGHAAHAINEASAQMQGQARKLAEADDRRLGLADEFEGTVKSVTSEVTSAIGGVSECAACLVESAERTGSRGNTAAESARNVAENVHQVASEAEQLLGEMQRVEKETARSREATEEAVMAVKESERVMDELSGASDRVGRVVKLIAQIASQTNLLALNATIEAARSGEAGKGFAVVASEVKTLAQQTSAATDEITQEITAMQRNTVEVGEAIKKMNSTIETLYESSEVISESVIGQRESTSRITRSSQQAADGTREVASSIGEVSEDATDAKMLGEQVVDSANGVGEQARKLEEYVERFLTEIRG